MLYEVITVGGHGQLGDELLFAPVVALQFLEDFQWHVLWPDQLHAGGQGRQLADIVLVQAAPQHRLAGPTVVMYHHMLV